MYEYVYLKHVGKNLQKYDGKVYVTTHDKNSIFMLSILFNITGNESSNLWFHLSFFYFRNFVFLQINVKG